MVEMSYPTYYISSTVANVVADTSKIIMLPPAQTIQGVPLYIKTLGYTSLNPIYVSTQRNDLMDNYASTIVLNQDFQSFRVVPYSTTRYAITLNYTQGLNPYQYALRVDWVFKSPLTGESWTSFAVSPPGNYMLATASGSTNPGFYVSSDYGLTFPTYLNASASFVSTFISGDGGVMLVLDAGGYFYISTNYGSNWQRRTIDSGGVPIVVGTLIALSADQRAREILIIDSTNGYLSEDEGLSFTSVIDTAYAGGGFRSVAVSDTVAYVGGTGVSVAVSSNLRSWSVYGPPGNWNQIVCSLDGTIAYARVSNFSGDFVYKTEDSGVTWTNLTSVPSGVSAIACSGTGSRLVIFDSSSTTLQISYDGGQTFTTITTGISWVNQFALNGSGDFFLGGVSGADLSVGQVGLV